MGNIFVLVEHQKGKVADITYELLAHGKELSKTTNFRLNCLLLGYGVKDLAQTLKSADNVFCIEHISLSEMVTENYMRVLIPHLKKRFPFVLLLPSSNWATGLGSLIAPELNIPFVNFCKKIDVKNGNLIASCIIYSGKMEADICINSNSVVLGMMPGWAPPETECQTVPLTEVLTPENYEEAKVRFVKYVEMERKDVDITTQDILVSIGRGIQNKENIPMAEELAEVLGGVVSASRPIVDQGWMPLTRQVGKSGMIVKPKLYLALGISGAPEHVEGMKNARLIVAINKDPNAPIFNVAQYGAVVDCLEFIEVFTETVKKMRGK